MSILLSLTLFYCSFTQILQAFPTEGISPDSSYIPMNEMQTRDYVKYAPATTPEADNSTNIISSVWHKITNIFGAETTTEDAELEMKHEVLMNEERMAARGEEGNGREIRMNPMDFSKHGERTMWEKETDEGNFYPIHQRLRRRRTDLDKTSDENAELTSEIRKFPKHDTIEKRTKKPQNDAVNTIPVATEEFEQGETEGGWNNRVKDLEKSTDWKTERIVVGSDPVENIDNENYIEETKKDDFPFHSYSIKPIVVVDTLSPDITTGSRKELSPLQIIEF